MKQFSVEDVEFAIRLNDQYRLSSDEIMSCILQLKKYNLLLKESYKEKNVQKATSLEQDIVGIANQLFIKINGSRVCASVRFDPSLMNGLAFYVKLPGNDREWEFR